MSKRRPDRNAATAPLDPLAAAGWLGTDQQGWVDRSTLARVSGAA